MTSIKRNAGSYRDPAGHVYESNNRIFRTINERARSDYEAIRDKGILREAVNNGWLIDSRETDGLLVSEVFRDAAYVVEHPRIEFVSYPYEWSFQALKAAALHHLDFQLSLLRQDVALSDASAYNIQFFGAKPIFIDLLSLRPYRQGEYWAGHRQFCEQFLNPLLLRSALGIAHNSWYRGSIEGISITDTARILPFKSRLSWNVLSQILLQAKLQARSLDAPTAAVKKVVKSRPLSRRAYEGLLRQMRNWVKGLEPADFGRTTWDNYAETNTYGGSEAQEKRNFVSDFAAKTRPKMLLDIGCNTGDYSVAALEGGASYVVGFDFDQRALDAAFLRSVTNNLNFLPLWLDAANPSPNQGWMQAERNGFDRRATADGMIALAFEHHLAVGRNIPLPQVVNWLIDRAPLGVIEFVPKSDPTMQMMLALREDIFDDYSLEAFMANLSRRARVVEQKVISSTGRTLFFFDRS